MKIIIYFALFVTIKSLSIDEFQKKFSPKFEELIKIIADCSDIEDVSDKINLYYNAGDYAVSSTTVQGYMEIINNELLGLNDLFGFAISEYLNQSLQLYYQTAFKLVFQVLNTIYTQQDALDVSTEIDMGDDNFCVTTFIDILGDRKYPNYHIIFVLKSIVRQGIGLQKLLIQLWHILKTVFFVSMDQYNDPRIVADTDKPSITEDPWKSIIENLIFELKNQKEKIKNFSKLFCLSTIPPYVDTADFFKKKSHEKHNHFIDYIFHEEMYQATVDLKRFNMLMSPKVEIKDRNFSYILETKEFGFDDYVNDQEVKNTGNKIYQGLFGYDTDSNYGNRKGLEASGSSMALNKQNILSLATWKSMVKLHANPLDILDFYSIQTEVMIFVLIKEGRKMLKGIKSVFFRKCGKNPSITISQIYTLRSRLLMFQFIFDTFTSRILEKFFVKYDKDSLHISFVEEVIVVLKYLEISEKGESNKYVQDMCRNINEKLKGIINTQIEGEYGEIIFEEYHFFDPIHHTFMLFNFNKLQFN